MKNKLIQSLSDYVEQVCKIHESETEAFHQKKTVYRGFSKTSYEICPSIGRRPEGNWLNPLLYFEEDLVAMGKQKCPHLFSPSDKPITVLAKLQHYGLPTRLMDVTSNALVALYFACKSNDEVDGKVVVFRDYVSYATDPYVNIIADTYCLIGRTETDLRNYTYRAMQQEYAIRLHYPDLDTEKSFGCYAAELAIALSQPILVEAETLFERQKHQSSAFIIFPNRISDKNKDGDRLVHNDLVKIDRENDLVVAEMIIPHEMKARIRDNLSVLGINREFIFPDNPDVILEEVKKSRERRYRSDASNLFS